ncbi:MAG: peptidylprolyl isomerase [Gemmatimonadaceae bacterium]
MRTRIAALALTAASAGALGAQAAPPTKDMLVDRVVAVVNTTPITWNEVMERINQLRQQGQKVPDDSAGQMKVAREVLDGLVDDEILTQRAKLEKVEVPDAEVSPSVETQMKKIQETVKSEDDFRAELRRTGFGTKEEFRRYLSDQVRRTMVIQKLISKLREEQKVPNVPVTDADVTAFFNEHKAEAQPLPATIAFRQIVIAPKPSLAAKRVASAKADSVLKDLKTGGDFEKLAKLYSMDPGSKEQGGDLGWQRRGEFVPEFERWYFGLPPGQLSPVFESTFGYHIIRVDRIQTAEVKGRHILIIPKIDSAQVSIARRLGDSLATALRGGAGFDALAKKYHDYDSKEQDVVPAFPRAQLPEQYQKAFASAKVGDVVAPFAIDDKRRGVDKIVVAQITAITEDRAPSATDYREAIRTQLAQTRSIRRLIDQMKKDTYVEVKL